MAGMIFKRLAAELDSIIARDPAARSRLEVALTYPGFHAVLAHRGAHFFWKNGFKTLGRMVSQTARWLTGIEIHPGAHIGDRLFIDHGMGTVIGEMAVVGDDVTLYQGVTLGGILPSVNSAAQVGVKRHPTLESGAIVGAGAQVLGNITVGKGARVGAASVVLKDVPPGAAVVGNPGRVVMPKGSCNEFNAYGIPSRDLPDPTARAIEGLLDQVSNLQARITAMEAELDEAKTHLVVNGTLSQAIEAADPAIGSDNGAGWLKEASR
ncbi:MAG TPA: serine O-acetyltransferase [Terriglobales bacterium]|nr:serine O-acetyltransferase [Terriglobales bacterium]